VTTPEQLANQIRSLCEQIDSKVNALNAMGFKASVDRHDQEGRLMLTASKTEVISL
jgi:hypothetical protein